MSTDLRKHPNDGTDGDPGGTPPPPPPPPIGGPAGGAPAPAPVRRIRRDTQHRVVSGVAAGLGRYTGIDPVIFRVLFVVSSIFGGVGVVLYALGWLLLPEDGDQASPAEALVGRGRSSASGLVTVLVAAVGAIALAVAVSGRGDAVTVLVLGVIATVVLLRRGQRAPAAVPPGPWTPPGPVGPRLRQLGDTRHILASHAERGQVADLMAAAAGAGLLKLAEADERMATAYAARTRGELADLVADLPAAWVDEWELGRADRVAAEGPAPVYQPPPRHPSWLGPVTLFAALVAVGIGLLVDAATGVDLSLAALFGLAVGTIGVGLLVGTWFGRARWLIVPALPLALAMVATSIVPIDLHGGFGERNAHPYTAAAIAPSYRLGAGQLTLDLTQLDWTGQTARTSVRLGAGQLVVQLPPKVDLVIRSHVRAGEIRIGTAPDIRTVDGAGIRATGGYDIRRDETDLGPDGAGGGTLTLDATVDAGQLEVLRAAA